MFGRKFIFASEPKVLLRHPCVNKALSLTASRYYLSFGYVPAPFSIYEGIWKLPASHLLKVERDEVAVERYSESFFSS